MKETHAVVIGGSIAGLCTARVLSDSFARVTVIDRDAYPTSAIERPGVPQSRHVHALLARGRTELNKLFPGFDEEMRAGGAHELDAGATFAFLRPTGWAPRTHDDVTLFFSSRTLVEAVVRRLARQRSNIRFLERTTVTRLSAARDGHLRVSGVRVTPLDRGATTELQADLVVDASGRSSKAPQWLQALGLIPPEETVVDSFSGYSTRWFKAPDRSALPKDWWWQGVWIDVKLPKNTLAGILYPVDAGRWVVTLGGAGKNYPPNDEAGFMATLHQLRSPIIGEMVRFAQPISPVYSNRAMANRLRHYERWPERLDGFLALGDSVCALNPIYGQGMTTGAISATILAKCVTKYGPTSPALSRKFFKAQADFQQLPWQMSTGADFRFPATEGKRPRLTHLISPYLETLLRAGDDDAIIRKTTVEVCNLLKMPTALLTPQITARVIKWWLQQKMIGDTGAGIALSPLPPALATAG